MPALRTGLQRFVVALFRFFEDALQTDEAAHGVVEVVEQLQCQQPRHAAIAIREGVDAEEVEDDQWHQNQRVCQVLVQRRVVSRDHVGHHHGGKMRGDRAKADARAAIGMAQGDVVVRGLPATARLRHVAVKDAVELQGRAFRKRHLLGAFVDQAQGIAITCDLLLRPALRRGILENQRFVWPPTRTCSISAGVNVHLLPDPSSSEDRL